MAASKSPAFQTLKFEEMLPLLASRYQAGRLTPFIGAGMSRTKLADWKGFVSKLEAHVGAPSNSGTHLDTRAQRAVATIRNSSTEEEFWRSINSALEGESFNTPDTPGQTRALAAIYWPLTISTNYDHLFYCACRQIFEDRLAPLVLGRSPEDCKQVMSGLVSPFDREIIWHIQGFLSEQCPACAPDAVQDPAHLAHLEQLRGEIVIGHAEYRRAANTAIHFRRCFGDVFRSRSFLFLGSSISEEYFWNLFGETIELCGPSPVPHFAFLKRGHIDVRFLAEEMNITVCEYSGHEVLVEWLERLKDAIDAPSVRTSRWQVELHGGSSLAVERHCHLPLPEANSDCAVALVTPVTPDGRPRFDPEAQGQLSELRPLFENKTFPDGEHVLCPSPDCGMFAVRARTKPEDETESDSVGAAIRELIEKVGDRWSILHLHLPAAGGTVPPVYGFIESVRAFGSCALESKRPLHLIAHVGPQVLLNLTSRQIDLHELLTSRLIRFWTEVNSEHGREPARRVLYRPPLTSLKEVAMDVLSVREEALKDWTVSLCPSPKHTVGPVSAKDLGKPLCDVGVVFGSVLTLYRTRSQPAGSDTAARGAIAGT